MISVIRKLVFPIDIVIVSTVFYKKNHSHIIIFPYSQTIFSLECFISNLYPGNFHNFSG